MQINGIAFNSANESFGPRVLGIVLMRNMGLQAKAIFVSLMFLFPRPANHFWMMNSQSKQAGKDRMNAIKTNINANMNSFEQGTALVVQLRSTMAEAFKGIRWVTGTVGEINTVSAEKRRRETLGNSVQHMNQVTQLNAPLTDEMVATASIFKSPTQELALAVAASNTK
jgi:hypothetical protein